MTTTYTTCAATYATIYIITYATTCNTMQSTSYIATYTTTRVTTHTTTYTSIVKNHVLCAGDKRLRGMLLFHDVKARKCIIQ